MVRIKDGSDEVTSFTQYRKPIKNRLSPKQLDDFDKELEAYRITKEIHDGREPKEIKILDMEKWMFAKGAMNKYGAIIIKNHKPSRYGSSGGLSEAQDCDPILYEQLMADLEQLSYHKGRKEFGEAKRLEGYEDIVNKF